MTDKRPEANERQRSPSLDGLAMGVAIGVGVGLALDNLVLGIAIGTGVGIALGYGQGRAPADQEDASDE